MLKSYSLVWLLIVFGGSLVNTFIWWLNECVFSISDPNFNRGLDYFTAVFIIGFIQSALCSLPSICIIYLIEVWKNIPFTIWLHVVLFGVHLVVIYLFAGFDKDAIVGFLGYEFIGIIAYYFLIFKKDTTPRNEELIDRN
jgi:hypothetical protein